MPTRTTFSTSTYYSTSRTTIRTTTRQKDVTSSTKRPVTISGSDGTRSPRNNLTTIIPSSVTETGGDQHSSNSFASGVGVGLGVGVLIAVAAVIFSIVVVRRRMRHSIQTSEKVTRLGNGVPAGTQTEPQMPGMAVQIEPINCVDHVFQIGTMGPDRNYEPLQTTPTADEPTYENTQSSQYEVMSVPNDDRQRDEDNYDITF